MTALRPSVTVVCPFAGSVDEARQIATQLLTIVFRPGDELLIVDNTPEQNVLRAALPAPISVVSAEQQQSSYFARNQGARVATASWVLFIDADCVPTPTLLDDYFAQPVPDRCGAIAGAVLSTDIDSSIVSRYATVRQVLDQTHVLHHPFRPYAATANLLVRMEAFAMVGGFHEGIRSAGDADFCWRLQEAGWTLEYRPDAVVRHEHRTSAAGLWRQFARYGAGATWLRRRHGAPSTHSLGPRRLTQLVAGPFLALARRHPDDAVLRCLDVWVEAANLVGSVASNRAPAGRDDTPAVVIAAATYPDTTVEALVKELEDDGQRVIVSAAGRGMPVIRRPWTEVFYDDDDSPVDRVRGAGWSIVRSGRGFSRLASTARALSRRDVTAVRASGQPGTRERAAELARLLRVPEVTGGR